MENNVKFPFQPIPVKLFIQRILVGVRLKAFFKAFFSQLYEFAFQRHAFRQGIDRKIVMRKIQLHIAGIGNAQGIFNGFRAVREG